MISVFYLFENKKSVIDLVREISPEEADKLEAAEAKLKDAADKIKNIKPKKVLKDAGYEINKAASIYTDLDID